MSLIPEEFFNRPISQFFPRIFNGLFSGMENFTNLQTRIYEENNQLHVEVPAPGLKPEDIDIRLNDGTLQIRADSTEEEDNKKRKFYRRSSRSYFNVITLPTKVDPKTLPQANYNNGILNISIQLPAIGERQESKRIPVTAGTQKTGGNQIEIKGGKSKKAKNGR